MRLLALSPQVSELAVCETGLRQGYAAVSVHDWPVVLQLGTQSCERSQGPVAGSVSSCPPWPTAIALSI